MRESSGGHSGGLENQRTKGGAVKEKVKKTVKKNLTCPPRASQDRGDINAKRVCGDGALQLLEEINILTDKLIKTLEDQAGG